MSEQDGKRPRLHVIAAQESLSRDTDEVGQDRATGDAVRALAGGELERGDHEALLALALGDDVSDESVMADERREAEALRDALAGQGEHPLAELCHSLVAAARVAEITPADHDALLRMTLGEQAGGDLDADERDEMARLAEALAGHGPHPLAELSMSLRAAEAPAEIDELSHERVLRRALRSASAERRSAMPILGAVVALAAGVALLVTAPWRQEKTHATGPAVDAALLIAPRSTQALFNPAKPFPVKGGESERLGKIVAARQGDLRANRFAQWGVK
jgi:hypothetical protein